MSKKSKRKYNPKEVLEDYRIACESRQASLLQRREVFMGKAKFGVSGDGKELAQIAMARVFKPGDFRSGYYRGQTFMFAIGEISLQQYFAQLYAHTDIDADPSSGGRQMISHFGSRLLDENGEWKKQTDMKITASDLSPTAGQMPRAVGFAYASKLYRENKALHHLENFSKNGNEISFASIGNAATAEGMFFEAINASAVLQIPMITSVWDDGYGISVPNEYQMAHADISKALEGFRKGANDKTGIEIFTVNGWDYEALLETYKKAATLARKNHTPSVIHVQEMTQPLGHSTSGSHERYKSKERLNWEEEFDCIKKMREWILTNKIASKNALDTIESETIIAAKDAKNKAWKAFRSSIDTDHTEAIQILEKVAPKTSKKSALTEISKELVKTLHPIRLDAIKGVKKALRVLRKDSLETKKELQLWLQTQKEANHNRFGSHLYSESEQSPLKINPISPVYKKDVKFVDGRLILQKCFDEAFKNDPTIFAIGEDIGKIGDVNQGFAGLQEKHGEIRITDTGIREVTIIGQGIGAAIRGLRPIVEIQYLDYLVYALMTLTDDLASLHYRTKGGQKAPLIIRTRGHRLEGIWHSGSPMGMIINSLRGIYILTPRNMTQAAGFYNTLLKSDNPALIIESLNGYRLKEKMPENVSEMCMPLGIPELLREGEDVTIVTYGSMCRIVMEAANQLDKIGISCEIIDVQTLVPFDIYHLIIESVKKTNRVVFADEDLPGGTSAYMMQKVIEEQKAFQYLDSPPVTIAATEHRPAYSSDGDYFSKPNVEDIFDTIYSMMAEVDPQNFPDLYE